MGTEETLAALKDRYRSRELIRAANAARAGMPNTPSQNHALFAVAAFLPQPFSITQLVLASWWAFPRLFGLDGEPDYPCSHRVCSALHAASGPMRKGLIERTEKGIYRTTAPRAQLNGGTHG